MWKKSVKEKDVYKKVLDVDGRALPLTQWTLLVIVVPQHMHKITNLWIFFSSISGRSFEIIMKEKKPLSNEVVCPQTLDFVTWKSNSEVSKSNSWEITSFSKTTVFQREPFLKLFYTIILPITCYQLRFYVNKYFEYLPTVSTAFIRHWTLLVYSSNISKHNNLCAPSNGELSTVQNIVGNGSLLSNVVFEKGNFSLE